MMHIYFPLKNPSETHDFYWKLLKRKHILFLVYYVAAPAAQSSREDSPTTLCWKHQTNTEKNYKLTRKQIRIGSN